MICLLLVGWFIFVKEQSDDISLPLSNFGYALNKPLIKEFQNSSVLDDSSLPRFGEVLLRGFQFQVTHHTRHFWLQRVNSPPRLCHRGFWIQLGILIGILGYKTKAFFITQWNRRILIVIEWITNVTSIIQGWFSHRLF